MSSDCSNQYCHSDGKKTMQWDVRRLRETCGTERHMDSLGEPWAWATANSRKYLVYCSMLKRSSSKAAVRFIPKYSSVDEARWKTWQNRSELLKKTARTWWKDWHRIGFSESSPVKHRKKDMKHHRWQVSNCIKRFIPIFKEKNLCTSELIKVTEARIWIFRRCLTKARERIRTHHCCIMLDLQDMKIHENLKDLWQEDLEYAKPGKHSHSCRHRIRTPTWRTSPTSTWKTIMTDCLWLIWNQCRMRWNSVRTANGSVLCYDTVPSEFFTKIINLKDWSERPEKEENKEEEPSPE